MISDECLAVLEKYQCGGKVEPQDSVLVRELQNSGMVYTWSYEGEKYITPTVIGVKLLIEPMKSGIT